MDGWIALKYGFQELYISPDLEENKVGLIIR
jgi:hypothetical protein